MSRLQPQIKKDADEYWITYGDFRCNFGGLFIISSPEPFRMDGFNVSRTFRTHSDAGLCMADSHRMELHRGRGRRSTAPHAGFHPDLSGRHRYNHIFSFVDSGSAPCSPQKLLGFTARKSGSGGSNDSYVQETKGTTSYNMSSASLSKDKSNFSQTSKSKSSVVKRFRSKESGSEVSTTSADSSGRQEVTDSINDVKHQHTDPEQQANSENTKSSPSQTASSPTSSTHQKTSSTSCLPSPRRRKSIGDKLKDAHHQHANMASEESNKSAQLLMRTTKANFMKKHSLDTTLSNLQVDSNSSPRNRSGTNPQSNSQPQKSPSSSFATPSSSSLLPSAQTQVTKFSNSGTILRPCWATPAFTETVMESPPSSPIVGETSRVRSQTSGSMSPTLSLSPPSPVHHSTSDISVQVRAEEDDRPQSAPFVPKARNSSASLNSLTQSNFLATSADYFRSNGNWKSILEHRDFWSRDLPSSDRTRLDLHSRTQRVHFLVTRKEQRDLLVPPTLQERRHVLVSLLQDYRHGPSTANSLTIPIGFCLYKARC
ncbi:calpain-13 [Elysia marginata]|uniref:Calpain-13 n=1 Tax=Elysia marginata TaxID=1093978 RepID=A0AAV4GGD0_9GAST|nr:calpain-13 [Elysia marginata]